VKYYKLVNDSDELLAVCKNIRQYSTVEWADICKNIQRQLGETHWWWKETTQVEFETYQAFGITEVKI